VDANLLIALFLRPEHALLAAAGSGRCRLVVCPYVGAEARRMIGRAFPRRLAAFERFLDELPAETVPDAPPEGVEQWRGFLSDHADVPVLAAAIHAGVGVIVTSDRAFRADARATLAGAGDPVRVLGVTEFLSQPHHQADRDP
jgi:predicted nucleic acid-binding protein